MRKLTPQILRLAITALIAFAAGFGLSQAREGTQRFTPLLSTSKTVMDEPIVYPSGIAKLTAGILTLQPGEETGWHTHGVPLTGLMLEGDLTVDYGEKGTRTFHKGESIAEAISIPHNGKNLGTDTVKLFVVYVGAEGVPAITPVPPHQ